MCINTICRGPHKANFRSAAMHAIEMFLESTPLAEIDRILDQHADKFDYRYKDATRRNRLIILLNNYEEIARLAKLKCLQLREEMVTEFRAIGLVAAGVGNAGTHRQKEIRAEMLAEIVNGAIDRLEQLNFDERFGTRYWPDLHQSEYPYRHYLQKIRELEEKIKQLEEKSLQSGETAEAQPDQIPF